MGHSQSQEIIAADTLSEDKRESFNVINVHAPTAGIGLSLAVAKQYKIQPFTKPPPKLL